MPPVPPVPLNSAALARVLAQESAVLVPGTAAMLADDLAHDRLLRLNIPALALRAAGGMRHLHDRSLAPAARGVIATLRPVEAEAQMAPATAAEAAA